MQPACIRYTDLPGTSRLFADFSYHFDRVARFYGHDPGDPESLKRATAEIDYPADRRAALVAALRNQNGESESLKRLAQKGAVAVVTGQQVGLFTGPAYTIYKALTAAKLARHLTDTGTPAVPIFWLATEDHDFPEVDHAWVFNAASESTALRVPTPSELARKQRPVGVIPVSNPPLADLKRALEGLPFAGEVVSAVEVAYRPGVAMGVGFRSLLKQILANLDLLYIDPLDPAIRKIWAPCVEKALHAAPRLKAGLLERTRELNDAGYHAQVHVDAKTSLFFLLENGERVTLRRKDSEYADLADRGAEVSPNALLRPVLQDYLLPTVAYIGGPGELAYLAQSQVIYQELLGRMPVAMSRSGFTLLDARSMKLLERYKLTTAQTFVHQEALKAHIAQALVPDTLMKSLDHAVAEVSNHVERLKADLEKFDHTLAASLAKSQAKILYQMEKIRKKTARETMRRDTRAEADARHLSSLLFPHRHLQERFYSILPFLAQHGMDLVDRLYEAVELDCSDHRVFVA
jgi:bacillithiol biosynthesis cysteine-adding enzyme BshC